MASHIIIFRITINSKARISINIEEPDGSRQFSADFGYSDALLQQVRDFQTKAQQKNPQDLGSNDVRRLGEALFQAIFNDNLQSEFERLYEQAQKKDALLRLELDIDEEYLPHIAAFPWEFMRPKTGTAVLLSASPHLILSRRPRLQRLPPQIRLEKDEKLRILQIASYPGSRQDAELGPIVYEPVRDVLQTLAQQPNSGLEFFFSDDARYEKVNDLLEQHKPHIFHFVGHGRMHDDGKSERGQLALAPEDDLFGQAQWIDAAAFSRLFSEYYPPPSLVVLQTCEGARLSESIAFAGVASRVVQQNVPAVVGMQYVVSNDTAVEFSETFYRQLAQDQPIDVAVQAARHAITLRDYRDETRDFATPVLFMRVPDGRLFRRKQVSIRQPARAETGQKLRQALARLNFEPQRYKFGDIYGKSKKMGAFLIYGPEFSGQAWLRKLLLEDEFKDELKDANDVDPLSVDIGTDIFSQKIQYLWDYFAQRLIDPFVFDVPQAEVAQALLDRWRSGHTIMILDNVCKRGATYPHTVIREFWQPLIREMQKILQAEKQTPPNHWFLLFLTDAEGILTPFAEEHLERSDPGAPIQLPQLDERFPETELEQWWNHGHTRFALKPALDLPQFGSPEALRQFLWQRSEEGKVIPWFKSVCLVCHQDWEEIEGM